MAESYPNYINGEWVSGDTFENRNPANTDEIVGLFTKGSPADIHAAADCAGDARCPRHGTNRIAIGSARGDVLAEIVEKAPDGSTTGSPASVYARIALSPASAT